MIDALNSLGNWGYAVIWGALILMFERAMYCGFVVDDVVRVKRMTLMKSLYKEGKVGLWGYSGMIWESIYGAGIFKTAKQEYIFNVALHGVNCSLIYSITGSLLAALLYLINPVNNQTALWCNGRRYAITILGALLIWKFHVLAFVMFPFMIWIHISGIALPALFLFTPYWPVAFVLLVIGLAVGLRRFVDVVKARKSEFKEGFEAQKINPHKLILYVKSVGYFFFHCLIPVNPAMYHSFLYHFGVNEKGTQDGYKLNADFYKGVLVLTLLGALMFTPHAFWAFWFLAFISIWCNIYKVTMAASDRYCSLANVGVMVLLAQGIGYLSPELQCLSVGLIAAFYIAKYQPLFRAYTSFENFLIYHIHMNPALVEPSYWLAHLYLINKDINSSFAVTRRALRFNPEDFKLSIRMLECMLAMKNYIQAFKVMDFAEKHVPFGEEEDAKELFNTLREKYKSFIPKQEKGFIRNIHNNGKPIVTNKG